jgi:hypothetical protein
MSYQSVYPAVLAESGIRSGFVGALGFDPVERTAFEDAVGLFGFRRDGASDSTGLVFGSPRVSEESGMHSEVAQILD